MNILTESKRDEIVATLWSKAKEEHDCDAHNVPYSVVDYICEVDRALYILLLSWDKVSNPIKVLKANMVRDSVMNYVATDILEFEEKKIEEALAPVEKRADKYIKLERHALANVYNTYTTDELMAVSGLSRPPLLAWLKTNGFYRSVKRGEWEARNPKEDRQNEKL